jgi:hypothetical protein
MVTLLFSSNKKIGSKLISTGTWLLEKDCRYFGKPSEVPSHVAVRYKDMVIESTLFTGVRIITYAEWLKINNPLHAIDIQCDESLVENNLIKMYGKKYDWLGIFYFTVRLLTPGAPKENKWQDSDKYFCTEFASLFIHPSFRDLSPGRFYLKAVEWKIG